MTKQFRKLNKEGKIGGNATNYDWVGTGPTSYEKELYAGQLKYIGEGQIIREDEAPLSPRQKRLKHFYKFV
jgi:hypothetical protein